MELKTTPAVAQIAPSTYFKALAVVVLAIIQSLLFNKYHLFGRVLKISTRLSHDHSNLYIIQNKRFNLYQAHYYAELDLAPFFKLVTLLGLIGKKKNYSANCPK